MELDFAKTFEALTGHAPFPWQSALYDRFSTADIPKACNLPTGLGKTSVIAIWLIALANKMNVPRRLVYVVNRRTVVDQTTDEVEKYFTNKVPGIPDFAISTLRGQFADNEEWNNDPSRPAVICGTVDMIGSRLLFSGYGIGRGKRPLHAGFLGQDALLIHDEAHLEPAFQTLILKIEEEQKREPEVLWPKFRVMELTATSKTANPFQLDQADYLNPVVKERLTAAKKLQLHKLADAKKPQGELARKALEFLPSGRAVLVFAYSVETVLDVAKEIEKKGGKAITLTGTMRGKERDELVTDPTFARFLPDPPAEATTGTVYLVCTSAGEVGVNISADHLVCDLSTFESMAQRLGRVNRFGRFPECEVHCFHPQEKDWDDKHALTVPRQKTLALLKPLDGKNVNPKALGELPLNERIAAFAPEPTILPTTDILFDAWALTTIRGKLPARPPVEPYLHGVAEWEPPTTQVAWREEVQWLSDDEYADDRAEVWSVYPLQPKEILKEPSNRAIGKLQTLAKRNPEHFAWLVDNEGTIEVKRLEFFLDKDAKDEIAKVTVVLDPRSGGLANGMLDGAATETNLDVSHTADRRRCWDDETPPDGLHEIYKVEFDTDSDNGDDDAGSEEWRWFVRKNTGEPTNKSKDPITFDHHVGDVVKQTMSIISRLALSDSLKRCLEVAAKYHDHGKKRSNFQRMLGNNDPTQFWAKSGSRKGTRLAERYRHEFGSLHDVSKSAEFQALPAEEQELVLHLIAAHHGRARPHFPPEEAFDPSSTQEADRTLASAVPRRFGRLQRKYGRWGLAYLESLLRAADWEASDNPSKPKEGQP